MATRFEKSGSDQVKRFLCGALLVGLLFVPMLGLTEGDDTIQLARTLYTLGRDESYETVLMIGSVIMNRVESVWYPDTLSEVLSQPHQFPHGMMYDDVSLKAARELMRGKRNLPESVLRYAAADASSKPEEEMLYTASGNYEFYKGK